MQGVTAMQVLVRSQMESGIKCLCDFFHRGRVPATPPIGLTVGGRLPGAQQPHTHVQSQRARRASQIKTSSRADLADMDEVQDYRWAAMCSLSMMP